MADFKFRHIGVSEDDVESMVSLTGKTSLSDLIDETLPAAIRQKDFYSETPLSEHDYLKHVRTIAEKNIVARSFIGQGYYNTITPPVILRNLFENPGWYTQYTPYQAEISQGRLESLLNFQTMICDLTGMDIANASLLDEGTSAAEAMTLLHRCRPKEKKSASIFYVSKHCFSQTTAIVKSRALPMGITVEIIDEQDPNIELSDDAYGALLQYPHASGTICDNREIMNRFHDYHIRVAVAADIMALVLLKSPGSWNADVVVGSSQRFGVPLGYGGPHAAFFATKESFRREIPGRIIGVSQDRNGRTAYRMALQTREQHIRREKATSNICTAQALLANMAAMYAVYHGAKGLQKIAKQIHRLATQLAGRLTHMGFSLSSDHFFDTIQIIVTEEEKHAIRTSAEAININFFYFNDGVISLSVDECTNSDDIEEITALFATVKGVSANDTSFKTPLPDTYYRTDNILDHPVFHSYQSETLLMRYLKQLEDRDLSLNTSMIPLGSCTMKLNAAVEMMPVSWPEFSSIHPFAPLSQINGYLEIFEYLEQRLAELTGFTHVSLQPNSGAQGELSGLLAITGYLASIGEAHRTVALIPSSAHGTNPASAVMAGLTCVIVNCDDQGNIDLNHLQEKIDTHADSIAVLMITYPSTHGVFEEDIMTICKMIHDTGGQVYMDGANMNAQVGYTSPGYIGADVCHLNLHKTFCIPHGGGGPGVGPICTAAHLGPFLPGHPFSESESKRSDAPVAAAEYGSASILLITYAYLKLMGFEGLKEATAIAILNANYIKTRLESEYSVVYTGTHGTVAHELIIDCRPFKKSAKIEVEDIAKRLIDYGFHAPTMSWPVPGTLMIEPTESEDKAELDRFCDAMIGIRAEIRSIENGDISVNDSPLKMAPHTALEATSDDWPYAYTREQAVYPLSYLKRHKFWPTVSRVDNAYGDRNLFCSCAPVETD